MLFTNFSPILSQPLSAELVVVDPAVESAAEPAVVSQLLSTLIDPIFSDL